MKTRARRTHLRSLEDQNALIHQWFHLVDWVFKRNFGFKNMPQATREDILQAGRIGLIIAAELYDDKHGIKFSTYATRAIWSRMDDEFERHGSVIHIPAYCFERKRPESHLFSNDQRKRALDRALSCRLMSQQMQSGELDLPAPRDELSLEKQESQAKLHDTLVQLGEPYRTVIDGRFFQNRTLRDIGMSMGITKERVRQIQVKALEMLREVMVTESD